MCSPYGGSSGKTLVFLGNRGLKPLCMGEWVCCGWCLVRLNVAFRGAIEHLEVVRVGWPLPATWVSISGKLWFWSNGGTKTVKKVEFPAGIALYEGTVFRLVFSQPCRV